MSDWFDPNSEDFHGVPFERTSPHTRRIDGMMDARHRGIRMSRDKDYAGGYDYEEKAKKEREAAAAARASG